MNVQAQSATASMLVSQSNSLGVKAGDTPDEVATAFEAVFASMLVKEMRNTLEDGFFGGESSDVLGGMFDMHIGQAMAESGGLGVKEMVLQHLSKEEELSQ